MTAYTLFQGGLKSPHDPAHLSVFECPRWVLAWWPHVRAIERLDTRRSPGHWSV